MYMNKWKRVICRDSLIKLIVFYIYMKRKDIQDYIKLGHDYINMNIKRYPLLNYFCKPMTWSCHRFVLLT